MTQNRSGLDDAPILEKVLLWLVLPILQTKLRALREYVRDLQSSYEELLDTFAQLENAARDRVASLEQQLVDQAKVKLITVFGLFLFICRFCLVMHHLTEVPTAP